MVSWKELSKNKEKVAELIDHTNVDVKSTKEDIRKLCNEVKKYGFCSAVVLPYHLKYARKILREKENLVTVVGFPYGIQPTESKITETKQVLQWVDEVDMVMNRTAFFNGNYEYVKEDIKKVVETASPKTVKVIIESPTLSKKEIRKASELVVKAGADFVKTAVGYEGPAKVEDVRIIKNTVGERAKVKASGGIHNFEEALAMVKAGADRIGASHGVEIFKSVTES